MQTRDIYDSLSPSDYRYWEKEIAEYLSENAFTRYKLKVELALVKVLYRRGLCSLKVVGEVGRACASITTKEVYNEEAVTKHDIRAVANCIRNRVSDEAKPFVHMVATSQDIIDTANAARYKSAVELVLLPTLIRLEGVLISIVEREANTGQIGRTHGQHAVPITFGFAVAQYVSRLGQSIEVIQALAGKLVSKFSGAVGAYNASSLFFTDVENFEMEVLAELGLKPAEISTQVVPPEALVRLLLEITMAAGILANLSDDMRHLQRSEIGEVGEEFEINQVGSSTMPQKQNPVNFENIKSCWKIVMPRVITILLDQICEHQRDLTNSASARTYGEIIFYLFSMAKRLTRTLSKMRVNQENLQHNMGMQSGLIIAEPLYIILASLGHPQAHEKVRQLTLKARLMNTPLQNLIQDDSELVSYLERMTSQQRLILARPELYIGIASEKATAVAAHWKGKFVLPKTGAS